MHYKTLCIDLTLDCNMKCPWCVQNNVIDKLGQNGYLSEETENILKKHIAETEYEMYSFHGGECTLYADKMFEMMDYIRECNPVAELKLFTNGSLLTDEMVYELNKRDVFVCVSVNGSGYKDIKNLKEVSKNYSIIDVIKKIKNFCLREIFTSDMPNIAMDILILREFFGNECHIEIDPDYTTLNKWNEKTLISFEHYLALLDSKGLLDNTSVMGSSCDYCDCPHENLHFYVDGTFGRNRKYHTNYGINGCAMMQKLMGNDIYAKFQAITQKYYGVVKNGEQN